MIPRLLGCCCVVQKTMSRPEGKGSGCPHADLHHRPTRLCCCVGSARMPAMCLHNKVNKSILHRFMATFASVANPPGAAIVLSIAALNTALRARIAPALVALALAESIDMCSFLNYAVKASARVETGAGTSAESPGMTITSPRSWSHSSYITMFVYGLAYCLLHYSFAQVSALVESRFNAVERLLAYAALPPEEPATQPPRPSAAAAAAPLAGRAPLGTSSGSDGPAATDAAGWPVPPPGWPANGCLALRDVWMAYRAGLDPVLKGVSFEVGLERRSVDGQEAPPWGAYCGSGLIGTHGSRSSPASAARHALSTGWLLIMLTRVARSSTTPPGARRLQGGHCGPHRQRQELTGGGAVQVGLWSVTCDACEECDV
jgi:hypothetical protein